MDMATLVVAAGRDTALARWDEFLTDAALYDAKLDYVQPGHSRLSRLSPALRHRLVLDEELLTPTQGRSEPPAKFVEGIHRRLFWRVWLEQRPGVWADWRARRAQIERGLAPELLARLHNLEQGKSGCTPIDYFARELVELGYMHQHARRWFACWWIGVEKLPWELGADFFYRYLLDANSALNTLSWRWAAGLQEPSPAPQLQQSDIERWCAPEILGDRAGLDRIAKGESERLVVVERADLTLRQTNIPTVPPVLSGRVGVWLHPDDLLIERSPLSGLSPVSVAGFLPREVMTEFGYGTTRRAFSIMALEDGVERAGEHFECPGQALEVEALAEAVASWVREERLEHVVAMTPFVGEWGDQLEGVQAAARRAGAELHLCRRPADARLLAQEWTEFEDFRQQLRIGQ